MEKIIIKPSKLCGTINIPPSKSLSHRAIICASLCKIGESTIENIILSDDIKATIEGMEKLGAVIKKNDNKLHIKRKNQIIDKISINCRESGSTLRFLIPIAMNLANECTFIGHESLSNRPLNIYYKLFNDNQIPYNTTNGKLPLTINNRLHHGIYNLSGSVSSQFITGLMFILPLLKENSIIRIIDKMESKGYIDMTLDILKMFNIHIENKGYKEFIIYGNSQYKAVNYKVEGDYSQAAFYLVANELGSEIKCIGLNKYSSQGDKKIFDIIAAYHNESNVNIEIDASQIPDLIPSLTVLASLKDNKVTKIINAGRLRIKETDRLRAITTEMNKLGANVKETENGLIILGKGKLKGNATVNSWNDHRIAMSLAIAGTKCENEIVLENYKVVNKSYPQFWCDYKSLGGKVNELNMG
ncbi:3-phosphoshikimate 1-carboxyvinyltransferase [Sedimentibacter sp. MB31-C6]|uniref:3-phosphoshikimate 1-carboxyvinyltransferase n=1 Tax=Sedimentibacter sp. MB31-C6 TaxID=3109366 RepID=UPI002DDCB7DA|nr:3-phosphoshikimate 1-carboxyvinyltransferase [Sedimentibacter sp. MB36-C1]WSI05343.1 3-phosphoshikimate 1-carboxyvinyltransferase [Sedimentibacter sp. MB36-C1]